MKLYRYLQTIRLENPLRIWDAVYLYVIGGFIGTVYEDLLLLFAVGYYENHSGSVITPINVVYGLGVVLMTFSLYKVKKWHQIIIFGTFLGGVAEYVMSYFAETVLGIATWKYDSLPMNIGGRTTIPYMIFWGIAFFLLIVFVIPFIIKLIHKLPINTYQILGGFLLGIIVMDWTLSGLAVLRYSQRYHGIFFDNEILKWFDRTYNDKFMELRYPSITFC